VAGVVLVCVVAGGVVLAGAVVVTVCAGAVTVLVGTVTVLVWVGYEDWTLTPRLLVVEVVCWLTTVEGDFDLLFEAITPARTPRAAITAISGQIQAPCRFDVAASCSRSGPSPGGGTPPSGFGLEPGGGEADTESILARMSRTASPRRDDPAAALFGVPSPALGAVPRSRLVELAIWV
jgi:hypothetical protein